MITYFQFEVISAILFVLILGWYIHRHRKDVVIQKILWPVFYIVMWRTKIGIKAMEKYGRKYAGWVRLFGYFSIGIGVVGLVLIFTSLFYSVISAIISPTSQAGIMLALPGSNIPGLGMLGFWHWMISIFFLAVVHEFAHGIVAIAHGIKVDNSGPAIFGAIVPIIPAAYVEPNEKSMSKSGDHVRYSIIAAGPAINIIFGILFFLLLVNVFVPIETNMTDHKGLSFETMEEGPAFEALGEGKFMFNSLDGKVVEDPQEFYDQLIRKSPGDEITLSNAVDTHKIILENHPDKKEYPYLGVISIKEEREFRNDIKGGIFSWFKNLIKWLAALNFFIGLANLLPLGPVDGGQMLRVFLEQVTPDKRKVMKWWGKISLVTLLLLLIGLLSPYISKIL
jgi:hypothetical protein